MSPTSAISCRRDSDRATVDFPVPGVPVRAILRVTWEPEAAIPNQCRRNRDPDTSKKHRDGGTTGVHSSPRTKGYTDRPLDENDAKVK